MSAIQKRSAAIASEISMYETMSGSIRNTNVNTVGVVVVTLLDVECCILFLSMITFGEQVGYDSYDD